MAISFPFFLKYPNNKSFFKLHSEAEFEELQIIGKKYAVHTITAKILPERVLIADMIANETGIYLASSAEEWEKQVTFCQENLTPIAL